MILFLVFSLPLLFLLVAWLPWGKGKNPSMPSIISSFLKGLLVFFPAYVVILILRGIFGFSYLGARLFFSLLLRDQLVPLLAAVGSFLVVKRKLAIPVHEEGVFLGVFSFLCGFMAMINCADMIRTWGLWDAYVLFLLPLQRVAAVLVIALSARRFYPWEGREALAFSGVAACAAVVLSVAGFLFVDSRPWWSVLLTVVPLLAAVVAFAMRFPRALRA